MCLEAKFAHRGAFFLNSVGPSLCCRLPVLVTYLREVLTYQLLWDVSATIPCSLVRAVSLDEELYRIVIMHEMCFVIFYEPRGSFGVVVHYATS